MPACRRAASAAGILFCILAGAWPTGAAAAETAAQTFTEPGAHAFVVPPAVTSLEVTMVGGNGGTAAGGAPGGIAATVSATLSVTPGETVYLEVAGNGPAAGGLGGIGGGGEPGTRAFHGAGGGGGGGASDIRTCSPEACGASGSLLSRLLVAGGGGGGGGNGSEPSSTAGGNGGSADQSGYEGHNAGSDLGGGAGLRGASGAGGSGGGSEPGCEGTCGARGTLGGGGAGGSSFFGGGGGGGAGIFGGGGGGGGLWTELGPTEIKNGGGGGGGGGASGVLAGASVVPRFSLLPTATGAEPEIALVWTKPAPTAVTGAPLAVGQSTATIAGSVNPNGSQLSDCHFVVSPAPPAGATLPCPQQVGAGSVPVPVSAALAGLQPGTAYTVTLVAASAQGSSSGAPVSFTTTAPPGSAASGAPLITGLSLSPTRFRRGHATATVSRRSAVASATTISFTLSAPATVTLAFERPAAGTLVGHRCLARSGRHARGRRCTRYLRVAGGISRPVHSGAVRIRFDGVLDRGARLAPGAYRLSLSAADPGGTATAPQHPAFTLLGP